MFEEMLKPLPGESVAENSALCRARFTATTAIKPTAAIAVTRAESCSLDHFDMLAETAGLIKGELHWSPSGSFQRPKPVQCTLMSLLINLKRNTMLTVARNDQGQFLWNRSGSTPWPEPVLCALLSVIDVSLDQFKRIPC